MLNKLRVALALVCWLCVTVLFCDLTGATREWLGWMAKIQFFPAIMAVNVGVVVLWVVVTLLVGRIYCSVICPLGVLQDGFIHLGDWLTKRFTKSKLGRFHYWNPRWLQIMRFAFLLVFVVALVMGGGVLIQWLAPYSSYGRIVTSLFRPWVVWANNRFADVAAENDSFLFYHISWTGVDLTLAITATVTAALLILSSMLGGRFYCNSICPVGTMLGLLSRRALLRVHIDESRCVKCGLCERKCKAMAIDTKQGKIDASRCVDCFRCLDACHKDAISLCVNFKGKKDDNENQSTPQDNQSSIDRRTFIATAMSLTAAAKLKAEEKTVDGGLAIILDKKRYERATEICPPGALSLKNLQQHCTGCQLCVAACPNGVLHPSTDMLHYMQPAMSYENGHCRPECHACSDVCPAGAIKPLGTSHSEKMARKASLKIGRAVWIKDNCLPLSEGVKCGNCARHCPTGAISMISSDPADPKSVQIPSVNEERCIGCGACEHLCPSRPYSAIHVEGIEVQREI